MGKGTSRSLAHFLLSGWAWANSVPDNDNSQSNENYASDTVKRFGLQAIIHYADNGQAEDDAQLTEYHYVPFCPDVHDWQFTSLTVVPKQPTWTVESIDVVCAYEKNANSVWFDEIALVRQAAQTMRYDDEGNLVSVTTTGLEENQSTYENGNLITSYTGGSGTYTYEYDDTYEHRLESVTDGVVTQSYGYDAKGNVTSTTLTGGSTNLSTSALYSDDGNRLYRVTDANGDQVWYYYESALSKLMGTPTKVCTAVPGTVVNSSTDEWLYTHTTYDNSGRISSTWIDKQEESTDTIIDICGTLDYTYTNGNLTEISHFRNPSDTQKYTLTYDAWGNVTSIAVADWVFATYTYGANNGQLQSMTYGNGNKVTYTYDILGRVKTETYYQGSQQTRKLSYTYTGDGQLYCVHDTETNEYQYFNYDTLGRLISSESSDVHTHNWYNAYNQLTKWEYTSPLSTTYETYTYDTSSSNAISNGKLTSMRMVSGDNIDYQYDALQRLSYKNIGDSETSDGIWERYTYSGSQVTGKKNWKNDTVATHDFTYTYDSVGNILTESDSINSTSVTYTYDELNQLTGATRNGKTESYTYDSGGNITSFNNGNGIEHSLVYDDRYNGDMGWGDLLRKVDGETITYDDIGNPLSYYNGYRYTMTWEQGRQLASVTYDGKTTSYQYNSDGIRTKKTNNNGSYVVYHLAGGKAIGETHFDANNAAQYYLRYTFDETGSVVGFSHWGADGNHWDDYYFVKNLQGDVLQVYSEFYGTCVASYTYDSWGNILTSSGAFADINPFRYRTYYYDSETWFYYLQSRYYDPSIGRFINADSFVSTGQGILGYNMFAYCNNNPVNGCDPCGTCFHRWDFWNNCSVCENKGKMEKMYDFCVEVCKQTAKLAKRSAALIKSLDVYVGVGLGTCGSATVADAMDVSGGISYDVIGLRLNDGSISASQRSYNGVDISLVFPVYSFSEEMYREFTTTGSITQWQADSSINYPIFSIGAYLALGGSISIAIDIDCLMNELYKINSQ